MFIWLESHGKKESSSSARPFDGSRSSACFFSQMQVCQQCYLSCSTPFSPCMLMLLWHDINKILIIWLYVLACTVLLKQVLRFFVGLTFLKVLPLVYFLHEAVVVPSPFNRKCCLIFYLFYYVDKISKVVSALQGIKQRIRAVTVRFHYPPGTTNLVA